MNKKPTILMVEDDCFLERMYASKLAREGLNVLTAVDGEKAMDIMEEQFEEIEFTCSNCGKKAKMGKFQRYCSVQCRSKATRLDSTAHGLRFR